MEVKRQITLVSAPAGFGKTTCISDWVSTLDNYPIAWLSLDPADDDPGRFFAYFIAALQKLDAKLGGDIERVIRSGQLPPNEIISANLINDMSDLEERILLVLDDFHVIQDRSILYVIEQLVANIPPSLHLVFITREDPPLPLARLRANNQLTEVRARDLRFTQRDINRYLNQVMGLALSQGDIEALEEKTEGWIAGLQLAAIAMNAIQSQPSPQFIPHQSDPSDFIATLSGSHRYILGYLTEQVLSQQAEDIQAFLLETSILDKLNGDVCNAVTGRSDSHDLLEQLFTANLFLIPLDDKRQQYRYHHLFASLLRELQNTSQEEKTRDLHRRASRYYAQVGMASEAIQHSLSAEDHAMAVELLESHAMEMVMQGYFKTVNNWVKKLPETWYSNSPRTHLAFAWALMLRGDYSQATKHLELLQATIIASPIEKQNRSIRAEWLVMQSLMLYMQGKITECLQMAAEALELEPEQGSRMRSMAYYVQASVYWLQGKYQLAAEIYQKSIRDSRTWDNFIAETMSTTSLAEMVLEQGKLHQAFEFASQAVERIERSGRLHPISAINYASLGDVSYHWFRIEEARRYFQRALQLSMLGGSNTIIIFCHVLLSRLMQIENDLNAAAHEIQEAADLLPADMPEHVWQGVVSQQVRVYLALERPDAAEIALQKYGIALGEQAPVFDLLARRADLGLSRGNLSFSIGQLNTSILRLILYQARAENNPTRLETGIEFADHLIARAFDSQQLMIALESLLLRAQMHAVLGAHPASTADYLKALELAEPEGFISLFVEAGEPLGEMLAELVRKKELGDISPLYVQRILEAISAAQVRAKQQPMTDSAANSSQPALIEPLTEREVDVLRLMAEGLKYKEIAGKLFISLNTVRYHIKAIYGKLNVSNRVQAIRLARQLRIL